MTAGSVLFFYMLVHGGNLLFMMNFFMPCIVFVTINQKEHYG